MSIRLLSAILSSKKGNKKEDSGLTLLECLVAIAVVGIASAVIAPVMLISVATRVQSQKAEQAIQLAKLEVDSIRIEVERGGDYSAVLSAYPKVAIASSDTLEQISAKLVAANAPTSSQAALNSSDVKVAKQVDINNDGDIDFAVQTFATELTGSSALPTAFKVGVRVYDDRSLQQNTGSMLTDPASLSLTSGEGQRNLRPLAVIYADIFQSDQTTSLCEYHRYAFDGSDTDAVDGLECS